MDRFGPTRRRYGRWRSRRDLLIGPSSGDSSGSLTFMATSSEASAGSQLQERQGRRPIPAVPHRNPEQQSNRRHHPPSCPGGRRHHLGVQSAVRMAQRAQSDPVGGCRNRLFVPTTVRSQVLQWGHSSRLSCHPGATRTVELIRRRFWWPTLEADTWGFVTACDVCSRCPPVGLLHPLPIPGQL